VKANDSTLFLTVLTHMDQYLHDYPAKEVAHLGYAISSFLPVESAEAWRIRAAFEKMFTLLRREHALLDLNAAASAAGFAASVIAPVDATTTNTTTRQTATEGLPMWASGSVPV